MSLNFSEADKTKYMSGQYVKELKIYFPDLHLTILNDEIYAESMTLEESIFDGNGELSIIGCISNRFSIEIRHQSASLKNANIQVSIRIDNGNWNRIFTGYVDSVETVRDRSYMKIQCYDALYKFQDRDFFLTYNALLFPVTIKNLRDALFNYIGVTQVATVLANDDISIPQTIEDGEIAVLDAIRAICEMNGIFGRINNEGLFQYYRISESTDTLPYPSDDTFPSSELFPGDSSSAGAIYVDKYKKIAYEDYKVAQIGQVVVREGTSDTEYGEYGLGSNTLLIEGNMWCQGLEQSVKDDIAENIYNKVKHITYRPFEATNLGLPWIQVGDAIAYYVYDYSSGEPVVDTIGFSLLSRYLKGIQWLEDRYSANGAEYQPKAQPVSLGDAVNEKVERLSEEVSHKQDTLIPGSGISINGNVISASGGGGGDYTEWPEKTGSKWIDGKDIWRFVYVGNYTKIPSWSSDKFINIEDLETLIDIKGFLVNKYSNSRGLAGVVPMFKGGSVFRIYDGIGSLERSLYAPQGFYATEYKSNTPSESGIYLACDISSPFWQNNNWSMYLIIEYTTTD